MTAKGVLVAGLVLAAIGTLMEFLTGVPGFPPVPPGPIILAAAAVIVAVVSWRWIPALGVAVALFIGVGAVVTGVTAQLLAAPEVFGQFLSALLQGVGVLVAIVAGVVALARPRARVAA